MGTLAWWGTARGMIRAQRPAVSIKPWTKTVAKIISASRGMVIATMTLNVRTG